jgi:hypothetical protein
MSGGRFWNEETQRWENGGGGGASVTPPPPPRPDRAPQSPPAEVRDPDAYPRPVVDAGDPHASPTVSSTGAAAGGTWPPVSPPARPSASGGYSRRTVWSVIGGAAAAGAAVSLVVVLGLGGGHHDHKGAAPTSSTTATTGPSPTPSATVSVDSASEDPSTDTPSAYPSSTNPPAGYTTYDDPEGFRIALPEGWQQQRSTVGSQYGMDIVNYRDTSGDRRLQVYQVAESSPDASFDLYLSSSVPKPAGFRELSLVNLDTADFTGSRLEYVADSLKGEPDIGTWHVVDERFEAADGKLYAIAAYGPDADGRADENEVVTTAVDWFCPSSASCGS